MRTQLVTAILRQCWNEWRNCVALARIAFGFSTSTSTWRLPIHTLLKIWNEWYLLCCRTTDELWSKWHSFNCSYNTFTNHSSACCPRQFSTQHALLTVASAKRAMRNCLYYSLVGHWWQHMTGSCVHTVASFLSWYHQLCSTRHNRSVMRRRDVKNRSESSPPNAPILHIRPAESPTWEVIRCPPRSRPEKVNRLLHSNTLGSLYTKIMLL